MPQTMSSNVLKKKGECLENDSGMSVKARALIESKRRKKNTSRNFLVDITLGNHSCVMLAKETIDHSTAIIYFSLPYV